MDRRTVLRNASVVAGSVVGIRLTSQAGRAASEVVSETTLPQDGARGLGVLPGESTFLTTHQNSDWYYVNTDGSVSSDGDLDNHGEGAAVGEEAAYVGSFELRKYPFEESEPVEREMPSSVYSLAYDESESELWVGGENGKVWKVAPETLSIQQTYDIGGEVFALAHDGTNLWIGEAGSGQIKQYDTSDSETVGTYEYPNAQTFYDYGYLHGHLWLEGDGTLYETDIDDSTPTPTPTETATISPTDTPSPTETAVPTEGSTPNGGPLEDSETEEDDLQDSDGDGVVDSEDYAPNDPEVQRKSDLQETTAGSGSGFGALVTGLSASAFLAVQYLRNRRD